MTEMTSVITFLIIYFGKKKQILYVIIVVIHTQGVGN